MQKIGAGRVRLVSSRYRKWGALGIVGVPIVGSLGFAIWVFCNGVHLQTLGIWAVQHGIGMLAVTIGAHRYFAHRSFKASSWLTFLLGVLSSSSQGSILTWVANHRIHHARSDGAEDPHSPWDIRGDEHVCGVRSMMRSHLFWVFSGKRADRDVYARDWTHVRVLRIVDLLTPIWIGIPYLAPLLINSLFWQSRVPHTELLLVGAFSVWSVQNCVFAINSLGHRWGEKKFETLDESKNNGLLAFLTFGEGWHNNHHAFPRSARVGLRPGELDLGYAVIALMSKLGLVRDVIANRLGADSRSAAL